MNEEYYINQCSSETKIKHEPTKYGFINTYKVNGGTVILTFNQYANGEDDYDTELVDEEIIKDSPVDSLASITGTKLSDMLGKEKKCKFGHNCTSNCRREGCPCQEDHYCEMSNYKETCLSCGVECGYTACDKCQKVADSNEDR